MQSSTLTRSSQDPMLWVKRIALVSTIVFGGFVLWASLAPLDSAAIAPGVITVESRKKEIEHLEGGIVDQVFVKDGDVVEKGQVLIKLADTRAKANHQQLTTSLINDKTRYARLEAELMGGEFEPPELAGDQALLARAYQMQLNQYTNRRDLHRGELKVLAEQVNQAREDLKGFTARETADKKALSILREQAEMHEKMVLEGSTSKSQLLDIRREEAEIKGRLGDYSSRVAAAKVQLTELQQNERNVVFTYQQEINDELQSLESRIQETEQALIDAADVLARVELVSPINGTVVNLVTNAQGSIVSPGETLMEIVPTQDELIIEALVKPEDIDVVRPGMQARIRLSAYNYRRTPPVSGEVLVVSADRIDDPQRDISAYQVRIKADAQEIAQLEQVELYPGMPAEVMILLDQRTVMDYLVNPILEASNRAFREQ